MKQDKLWNLRFHQLAEYKLAHGNCNVPQNHGPSLLQLGQWVRRQREVNRQKQLTPEREEKLNSIGFTWKVRKTTLLKRKVGLGRTDWNTRFEQLEEYKKASGDCNVHISRHNDKKLKNWAAVQREAKKHFLLSEEREAKLNSIGFVWNIDCYAEFWAVRFQQLLEYKEAAGDCNVPQRFSRNPQLGEWVLKQRKNSNNKLLTKERWTKLDSIGFDWRKRPRGTNYKYHGRVKSGASDQQLEETKQTSELCHVPEEKKSNENPPRLNKRATEQRLNRQKKVIEKETRMVQLNANDISRNPTKTADKNDNSWDALFRELLAYLQTRADNNAPQPHPRNPLLARWVSEQRHDYDLKRRGEQTALTPLREAKLDAIGFTWFVGGDTEDACLSSAILSEESTRGNKVRSENIGVACPDRITSG
jgi:hypothetical protein